MTLLAHPAWPRLRPYVAVERDASSKTRVRIELRRMPPALVAVALAVEVGCVACGRAVNPIRARKGPGNKRSEAVGHGLYVAPACPLSVNVGCSRGTAVRDEYLAIQNDLAEDPQLELAVGG